MLTIQSSILPLTGKGMGIHFLQGGWSRFCLDFI